MRGHLPLFLTMKTLNDYVVTGALYQSDTGPEAQVNDQVKLYLDTEAAPGLPEYVVGVIQHPITKVQCNSATSYDIEYDEADLDGALEYLRVSDVIDAEVITAYDVLEAALNVEIAARVAADAAQVQTGSFTNDTGGTTTVTIPAGCEFYTVYGTFTGTAGTRTIILDTTNAVVGAEIEIILALPETAAIIVDFRNATAGGTQLDTITTDTSGDDATVKFGFTTAWNKIVTQYPN